MIIGDDLYITNNQQQSENGALLILSGWRPAAIVTPPLRADVADCPYQSASDDPPSVSCDAAGRELNKFHIARHERKAVHSIVEILGGVNRLLYC